MSLDNVRQFQRTSFSIPRHTDKKIVEKLAAMVQEGGYRVERSAYSFTFSDQSAEFAGDQKDAMLEELFALQTITTRNISYQLNGWLQVTIERPWEQQPRKLTGNQDVVAITPIGQQNQSAINFAKAVALARKHFEAVDTKPFMDYLDEANKQVYQSREQDLQKLERLQETFFQSMTEFTLDQQRKQQEFQRQQEAEYTGRQTKLEEQHRERLNQFEAKEADLKKIRAEIDERENRQARRDIYKGLKKKLEDRNKEFELTEGTKRRRRVVFGFTLLLLALFLAGFVYCFYKNVVLESDKINWIAVGSQIGFAVGVIGVATFFIRWNHQWFQKHADEEFKLKRLDLDIDRADWLVELAMEWKNIMKSEIPPELIDKLARSLFVAEETKDIDIHPAETLLSALFGKAGSINVEFPGKLTMQRSEAANGQKKDEKAAK